VNRHRRGRHFPGRRAVLRRPGDPATLGRLLGLALIVAGVATLRIAH